MKRLLILAAFFTLSHPGFAAETYTFDKTHTNIVWHANHLGFSNSSGKWMDVEGKLTLDEKNPDASKVEATINVNAIITGIDKFDDHLRSADFFNTAKFPQAKFVSTKVELTGKDTAKVTGDLTIHGVTKNIVLDVKMNKLAEHPMTRKKTVGFSATTTLKRSDFGISYALPMVSDEVPIAIETELMLAE